MRNSSRAHSAFKPANVTVSFGERFQASEKFDVVFKEGMGLVERAANYLEGPGRAEAKRLSTAANILYSSESMRLTTRLLNLASWLLIRRAYKEGELTEAQAKRKRERVKLQSSPSRPSHVAGYAGLPDGLRGLIDESYALHDRIVRLDSAMNVKIDQVDSQPLFANPVGMQMERLRSAFEG
jgi:regulator of CtrA degradation